MELNITIEEFCALGQNASAKLKTQLLNSLRAEGFNTVKDLVSKSEIELSQIPHIGIKALTYIKDHLASLGLKLSEDTQNPYHSSRMDQPDGDLLPVHLIPKAEEYYQETKVPHPDDA